MNSIQKSFLIVGLSFSPLFADQGKVADLKMYSAVYPASSALGIPFNGKVVFNSPNELAKGEHWFSVEHLPTVKELAAKYFKDIEVLASDDKVILGGRATFKGDWKAWNGDLGVKARLAVIDVFVGGEENFTAKMQKPMQVFNAHGDFGGMVFTFDVQGVSWRKLRGMEKSVKKYEVIQTKVEQALGK